MKKWISNLLYGTLITASCVAVGFGSYMIASGTNVFAPIPPTITVDPPDWTNFTVAEKEFWQKNSFRVYFGAGNSVSQGTAWSFYIDDKSEHDVVDWYLATNFHVVNGCLYYNDNKADIPNGLVYNHVVHLKSNTVFALQDTIEKNDGKQVYRSLFTHAIGGGMTVGGVSTILPANNNFDNNADVTIITDNSRVPNSGDLLNLFSNSIDNISLKGSEYYNLDMALFRIRMKRSVYNNNSAIFSNIANPYGYWLNHGKNNNLITFQKSEDTFIGGNPASQYQLIAQSLRGDSFTLERSYTNLRVSPEGDSVQRELARNMGCIHTKNWYTNSFITNWLLSEGASGSAVYQAPFTNRDNPDARIDPKTVVPVGIYWGGGQNPSNADEFKPMFNPFVTAQYNVFENFENALRNNFFERNK